MRRLAGPQGIGSRDVRDSARDFRFINWRHCIIKDMDLRPLHDRVLVKRLDEGEQKQGGIIIPDTAKEKPQQAEVKAVGSGKRLDSGERVPVDVKPGERILFGKYSGADIKVDGDEYLILREDEILGVLE
jgi:chaperonin GroES